MHKLLTERGSALLHRFIGVTSLGNFLFFKLQLDNTLNIIAFDLFFGGRDRLRNTKGLLGCLVRLHPV